MAKHMAQMVEIKLLMKCLRSMPNRLMLELDPARLSRAYSMANSITQTGHYSFVLKYILFFVTLFHGLHVNMSAESFRHAHRKEPLLSNIEYTMYFLLVQRNRKNDFRPPRNPDGDPTKPPQNPDGTPTELSRNPHRTPTEPPRNHHGTTTGHIVSL